MDHEEAKIALMGYLDGELEESRRSQLEEHLAGCAGCRDELGRFRSLREVMKPMKFQEPGDQLWDEYWTGIYNRMERGVGWIFVSLGAIVLISFGLFQWVKAMLGDAAIPWYIRGAIFFLVTGLVILLVSVARERIFLHRTERYKEVKR